MVSGAEGRGEGIGGEKEREYVPKHHDDRKTRCRHRRCRPVRRVQVLHHKHDLVPRTTVRRARVFGMRRKPQLGNQLVDGNDKAHSRNEAAQKRPAQHAVKKSQPRQARGQHHGTSQAGNHAGNLRVQHVVILAAGPCIDARLDGGADQQ